MSEKRIIITIHGNSISDIDGVGYVNNVIADGFQECRNKKYYYRRQTDFGDVIVTSDITEAGNHTFYVARRSGE